MGIIEAIFGLSDGDSQRISRGEFHAALHKIPDLSEQEIKYLIDVFNKDLENGLTAFELKNRIEKLRHNPDDILDPWEVEQVRRKLLGEIEKK